jgi:FAD/FMN-containing dehydrogenase
VANPPPAGALPDGGVMRLLKTAIDPQNLLNPGKILPER